ncbi:MAG: nuclear transport factor 2 family protein [Cyanobacteria bacterium P01_F01_bin.150]
MKILKSIRQNLKVPVIGLGCFSAFAICGAFLPAKAEPLTPVLTDSEILNTVSGRTTIGPFADRIDASEDIQALPNFEQIIKEQYFALWRDTASDPYSVDEAQQLYLTDRRLTSFDTDALSVEGEDSRIEGWTEYSSIWPEVFEDIKYFEAREVRNLQVRSEGDWALVTFDMAGNIERETSEVFDVFKHFTLLWIETADGWRIMHEHISDGQPPIVTQ